MKNVEYRVDKKKLIITIDTSQSFGLSKSEKSEIIASTGGNRPVDGLDGIFMGLNLYRKVEKK